jgi:PadR family transcriptional regulator, regulatory protein PadR
MQSRRNQRPDSVGEFETLVLMAILRLGADAYGLRIHDEIDTIARRRCSFGALYTTLDRLEGKGYVSSRLSDPTPERGGRAKKYFRLEAAGSVALKGAVGATLRMMKGLEPLLGSVR